VLFFWVCLFNGARIEGGQNLKGLRGAVSICNHVHKLDSALVAIAFYPRKLTFPTRPDKVKLIIPGILFRLLGCISVPQTISETGAFFSELESLQARGGIVHFFPEGFISPYSREIHSFKRGAFHLAAGARTPVLPMAISFREPSGFYKVFKKKPVMLLTIGEPMAPVSPDAKEDELARMENARQLMAEMLRQEQVASEPPQQIPVNEPKPPGL